jgi:hypothetical protein
MPGVITPGGRIGDPSPVGTPGGKQNWVDKVGGLPTYIRMVAHALIRQGKSESHAIAIAVATMKRWAAGAGNVSAKVQAAAAAALAEWEAKRGGAHVSKNHNEVVELLKAEVSPIGREMLAQIKKDFKFGRVPVGDITSEHVSRAARDATRDANDPARPYAYPEEMMDPEDQKYVMQNASDDNLKVAWAELHRQHVSGYGNQSSKVQAHKAKLHIEKEQARRAKISKKTLTAKGRKKIKGKNFALPGERYPIHDKSHARNALSRVSQHGTPEEKKKVKRAVKNKYPNIGKSVLTQKEFDAAAKLVASGSSGKVKKSAKKSEVTMQGEISKVDNDQRLVFGWASVGIRKDGQVIIDKQRDFIDDPAEIEKAAYNFVLHSRDGGEMHIRKGVSTLVESFVITPEKRVAMGIPDGVLPKAAWWTGWKVHDEDVWKGVKSGKYKMFSVHGKGQRKRVEV